MRGVLCVLCVCVWGVHTVCVCVHVRGVCTHVCVVMHAACVCGGVHYVVYRVHA